MSQVKKQQGGSGIQSGRKELSYYPDRNADYHQFKAIMKIKVMM
jgi:hypothetical protein